MGVGISATKIMVWGADYAGATMGGDMETNQEPCSAPVPYAAHWEVFTLEISEMTVGANISYYLALDADGHFPIGNVQSAIVPEVGLGISNTEQKGTVSLLFDSLNIAPYSTDVGRVFVFGKVSAGSCKVVGRLMWRVE